MLARQMKEAKYNRLTRLGFQLVLSAMLIVGMIAQLRNTGMIEAALVSRDVTVVDPPVAKTLPHTWIDRNWCPNATCHHSAECYPCRRRYLIILATGRSASTTLTWMLGSLPGIRMSGENNDALNGIRHLFDNIMARPFPGGLGQKGAWGRHPLPPGSLACAAQGVMQSFDPPAPNLAQVLTDDNQQLLAHEIIGFKTIRFHEGLNQTNLPTMVKFLRESFPCARFVVNIRGDLEKQLNSMNKAFRKQQTNPEVEGTLEQANNLLSQLAQALGKHQAIFLDSAQWTKDVTHLNRVVKWLGYHDSCVFDTLLEYNTGQTKSTNRRKRKKPRRRLKKRPAYRHGRTEVDIRETCHYLGE